MATETQPGQPAPQSPQTAAEPTTPAPSEPTAVAADSQPQTTHTPGTTDPGAVDAEGYAKLMDELRESGALQGDTPAAPDAETSNEQPQPTEPQEEPATPETPETPSPTPPEAQPPADVDDVVPGKNFRPRLGNLPDHQKEIVALVRQMNDRGTPIDFTEAERRVNVKYGLDKPAQTQPATPTKSVTEFDTEIAALREEKKKAAESVDTLKMFEIDDKIEALREQKAQVIETQRQAQHTAAQRHESALNDSRSKAKTYYPAILDEKSPLSVKFDDVLTRLTDLNDPILNDPNAPLRITQMAAAELGIAPVDPTKAAAAPAAAQPVVKPSAPAVPAPQSRPVQPASGAARSVVQTTEQARLEQKIDAAKTPEEYNAILQEAGLA